jgi:DNA-binding PadR family transcriptional regulator
MADIPHNARQQNRAPRRLTKENLAFGHFFVIVEQMAKRGYLGEFEFLVILALLRLRENGYGVQVSREIERRCGRGVSLGSLYATLERLEEQGLVSSSLGEPTVERGGRAKRYFHVTTNGLKAVRESQRALSSMWEGLPQMERA